MQNYPDVILARSAPLCCYWQRAEELPRRFNASLL